MKQILSLLLLITAFFSSNAQSNLQKEKVQIIANMVNEAPVVTNYILNELNIDGNIQHHLKLNQDKIILENPRVFKEIGKGWYLQYTFKTTDQIGLYKEQLTLRNDKLVITESRSAIMAKAKNCKKIVFTNDKNRCSCAVKKDYSKPSEAIYRLFQQVN